MLDINAKIVRLITDNASNNIKAFQDLIIPGFEEYFDNDNNDESSSDVDLDAAEEADKISTMCDDGNQENMIDIIKTSFDNIAASNESMRLPCFSHCLNLVVSDGLKEASSIKQVLSKVSKIAKLSHSSTIFVEKLESMSKSIPKANKTPWNSQFNLVEKLLRIPSSDLSDILTSIKRQDLCLLTKDYQILNEFISLFILLAEATVITQGEKTPSISFVAPTILAIYFDLLSEKEDVTFTLPLCKALLSSLISRFGDLFEQLDVEVDKSIKPKTTYDYFKDPLFIYTPSLDGKFKLHWINESSLLPEKKKFLCEKIKQVLYDFCVLIRHSECLQSETETQAVDDQQTAPVTPSRLGRKRKSLFSNIENKNSKKQKVEQFGFIKDEINNYLNDDSIDESNRFALLYQSHKYPSLHSLSLKVLTVPATSSPVERVFSQSGFLFRQHRGKMPRKMLQMLTMLKINKNFLSISSS
ncbi:unnamed protein product [Adineta ricciae]|uniref:HAT C-terminal dimerisation domain-containing protein n=1 Tax=Adineta ricciae TaxID=249248 RepID=A0A815SXZ5_ADIRI|nr:unnamed protein product [Adineta ricciae]